MKVFGIDFTSRPSRSKAITCAWCRLDDDRLVVEDLQRLESLDAFDAFLDSPGPWIAGIDFPFGQPCRLVRNLNWPESWAAYVAKVAGLSRHRFRDVLEEYKRDRPDGDREHLRLVDGLTGAQSPSKLYGVPVALMFYEGSQRLLRSATCVIPVRPTADDRVVVEAYPALVARALVGKDQVQASGVWRCADTCPRGARTHGPEACGRLAARPVQDQCRFERRPPSGLCRRR